MSLVFDTAQPGQARFAAPDVNYYINQLEYGIRDVDDYESSRWLSFVLPFRNVPGIEVDLGKPSIPLPLRGYPVTPSLVAHQAVGAAEPESIEAATLWSYVFTYEHQSAAQESVGFAVDLNLSQPMAGRPDDHSADLFTCLAQYMAVREPLLTELKALAELGEGQISPPLAEAFASYVRLFRDVADAWKNHWSFGSQTTEVKAESREFAVELSESGGLYRTLRLQLTKGEALTFPSIVCITSGGRRVPLAPVIPPSQTGVSASHPSLEYVFTGDVDAFTLLRFEYSFAGLRISSYQNARARVWVTRNAQLLEPPAPATREQFVYRTPEAAFSDLAVPSLVYQRVFQIGKWSGNPPDNPLHGAFGALLPTGTGTISFTILYRYALAPPASPDQGIFTHLPALLRPAFPYSGQTIGEVILRLDEWEKFYKPTAEGGSWVFDVTYYSTLYGERPLLRLARLVSALE